MARPTVQAYRARQITGLGAQRPCHPAGCNFRFCDGSVRCIKETVNRPIFSFLSPRTGGEVISADQF